MSRGGGGDSSEPGQYLTRMLASARQYRTACPGGELVWQQWSDAGTPLLLLHGGFGSWNHWVGNIPGLREQRRLLTVDLPGLGESCDMPAPQTPEHYGRLLLSGLDSLLGAATHFELAGFSFGAMIGAHLAARAGSRCERFTLIGAAGFGKLHVQVPLQRSPGPDTAEDEARLIHHANLRALMFSSDEFIDDLAIHAHAINLARHRFNSRKLSLSSDCADTLRSIKARLVGVWGSRDATAGGSANIGKRRSLFRQAQADAEFHVLEGVGHWAMYEAATAVNKILLGQAG